MASFATAMATGFDGGGRSFYDHIMELGSRHKGLMTEKLYYKVYVHSPFVYHHRLVLVDKEEHREHVTIELTIDATDGERFRVAPKAELYSGGLQDLNYKGQVYTSLEHFCEVAYQVLLHIGSYNLAFNNCQHFCDEVLKEFGLSGHTTDTTTIGVGAALVGVVGAMGLAAYGVYKLFSSKDQDSHGKGKRRNL